MIEDFPDDLLAYIEAGGGTCVLLKIIPAKPGTEAFGITDHDQNIKFDSGSGELVYSAPIGADTSSWETKSNMDVDNAEATGLVRYDLPLNEEAVRAGSYDYASWEAWLYPWENPSISSKRIRTGELGQIRIKNGQGWVVELLGLAHRLQRNFVRSATRACSATFGSQPVGTEGAETTERYPCGKDTTSLWVGGEVTGLGEDTQYAIDTDLSQPDGYFKPGALRWLTGKMAGRTYEVEDYAGGVVFFSFPLDFAPEIGDEFQIRVDCTKWKNGANGCKHHFSTQWVLHYRGFPDIPNGEQDRLNSPGASG